MRHISAYSKYWHYLRHYATPKKLQNMARNIYEFKKGKEVLSSRPFRITIDPGSFCNLRCPGCHTGIKHPDMIQASFMKYDNYKVLFDKVADYAVSVALYNWGEPFLNKQIFDIISYTSSKGAGTTVHSNFNIFNEKMAEDAVRSGLTHIYMSIDGSTQENYAKYRVRGNLDNVLDHLKILTETKKRMKSKYPLVTWKFLEFEHNRHELEDARALSEKYGVDAFESFVAWPKLMDIKEEAELFRADPKSYHLDKCKSLWSSLYVNPEGKILPCSLSYKQEEIFGDLLQDDLGNIVNNDKFRSARRMFSEAMSVDAVPEPCRSCKYFVNQQCAGR